MTKQKDRRNLRKLFYDLTLRVQEDLAKHQDTRISEFLDKDPCNRKVVERYMKTKSTPLQREYLERILEDRDHDSHAWDGVANIQY
jgi:hypothetical protein